MKNIFFLGIGGIGMSALARYYKHEGYYVAGYDRTPSALTHELEKEGIVVTCSDNIGDLRLVIGDFAVSDTLVVRTPAVPEDQPLYTYFRENNYTILKRAEVLGMITRQKKALCVAGTHGKTTTSTMLAHLMNVQGDKGQGTKGVNAFLGGISNNYHTNLLLDKNSEYVVVEADEYDRSFHHLTPYMTAITSIDPDHLDIYGSAEAYQEGFDVYAGLVQNTIILKHGYHLKPTAAKVYTYGVEQGDFHATNIRVGNGTIIYDLVTPQGIIPDMEPGVPVWVNIENSIAAVALAWLNGVQVNDLRQRLKTYKGVYRRFDIHVKNDKVVCIDDYAHHPTELQASIDSVKRIYPERKLIVAFQPHLYTRTRDFMDGFASVLSQADELLLLPIYPAREKPIEGITSDALAKKINKAVEVVQKKDLAKVLRDKVQSTKEPVVVMTLGAGDIDRLVEDIKLSLTTND